MRKTTTTTRTTTTTLTTEASAEKAELAAAGGHLKENLEGKRIPVSLKELYQKHVKRRRMPEVAERMEATMSGKRRRRRRRGIGGGGGEGEGE